MSILPLLFKQAELLGAVVEIYWPSNDSWIPYQQTIHFQNAKYRLAPGQEKILHQALELAQQHFVRISLADGDSSEEYLINASYAKHGARFQLAGSWGRIIELDNTVPELYRYVASPYEAAEPEKLSDVHTFPYALWSQYWGGTPEQLKSIPLYKVNPDKG